MKKIVVSFGLAAAGAASVPSLLGQGLDLVSPKTWNVSANLRGFYDDNYTVAHDKTGSFGWNLMPSGSANLDLKQTDIGVRYTFGMYYYFQRADNGLAPLDYTHQADFWVDHSFTERVKLNVADSFVVGQDPKLVQGGAVTRVQGNNVANHADLTLTSEWTRQFSTSTHYGNGLYLYSNTGSTNLYNPSDAALLNRMEQTIGTDFIWNFQPEMSGFIGYSYTWVRYTYDGPQQLAPPYINPPKVANYGSGGRDYNTHTFYVGASDEFSPNLSAQGRVGASYTDSYADPVNPSTSWSPYANVSVTYTYIPGCYMQAGFTQGINSTDVATPAKDGSLTEYQESSVFYFDVNHQFSPKFSANLVSQYQYSSYNGGAYQNSTGDSSVNAGVNLNYTINRHFSANAGYNFSELFSNINSRGNSRNEVYIGLAATY
jgi:Putative beta-barrel porin 2